VLTLGVFYLILNALLIMLAARMVDGFVVTGFWAAFFGSIVLSLVNSLLQSFLKNDKQ
jgi:putative membrane protein